MYQEMLREHPVDLEENDKRSLKKKIFLCYSRKKKVFVVGRDFALKLYRNMLNIL